MATPIDITGEPLIQLYLQQALQLCPPGSAINRRTDSDFAGWLESFCVEFARIHESVALLYQESYPGTATSAVLLSDWETLLGLPNECTYLLTTEADRQTAVLQKLAVSVGQSKADFQSIASDLGYDPLNVSTYQTTRAGVARSDSWRVHESQWLFASRMSYEVADPDDTDADAALECNLDAHKHSYAHINHNGWDAAAAKNFPDLRQHFVHDEFTTHAGSGGEAGLTIIDEWTNRATSTGAWVDTGTDSTTSDVVRADGWNGVNLGSSTRGAIQLEGMNMATSGNATDDTLLVHQDFMLFLVVQVDGFSGTPANDVILADDGTGDFTVYFSETSGIKRIWCDYDGGSCAGTAGVGGVYVVGIGAVTATVGIRVYSIDDIATYSSSSAVTNGTIATTDDLVLGGSTGFDGSILEMISGDYLAQSNGNVTTVYQYLLGKYLV